MTVTLPSAGTKVGRPWTFEDLMGLPDDGYRYEIFEGALVVSPPPAVPHVATTTFLHKLLILRMPPGYEVVQGPRMYVTETNFYVPDLAILREESLTGAGQGFSPSEFHLAVEVVSPSNPSNDHVWKRRNYAKFGVTHYWIVDPRDRTIRVLELGNDESYVDKELLRPGQAWTATHPFEFTFDPAEVFRS